MAYDAGSTKLDASGSAQKIRDTEEKLGVIWVRNRPGNKGRMWFGVSDVSSTNGVTLKPSEAHAPNFEGGSELSSLFWFCGEVAGEYLDWSVIIRSTGK